MSPPGSSCRMSRCRHCCRAVAVALSRCAAPGASLGPVALCCRVLSLCLSLCLFVAVACRVVVLSSVVSCRCRALSLCRVTGRRSVSPGASRAEGDVDGPARPVPGRRVRRTRCGRLFSGLSASDRLSSRRRHNSPDTRRPHLPGCRPRILGTSVISPGLTNRGSLGREENDSPYLSLISCSTLMESCVCPNCDTRIGDFYPGFPVSVHAGPCRSYPPSWNATRSVEK